MNTRCICVYVLIVVCDQMPIWEGRVCHMMFHHASCCTCVCALYYTDSWAQKLSRLLVVALQYVYFSGGSSDCFLAVHGHLVASSMRSEDKECSSPGTNHIHSRAGACQCKVSSVA